MIRFLTHQYKFGCGTGLGRRESIARAVRIYLKGFK